MTDAASSVAQIIEGLEPGAMVTKFVVVAEVINADGVRGVWVNTQENAERWDTLGLLHHAIHTVTDIEEQ